MEKFRLCIVSFMAALIVELSPTIRAMDLPEISMEQGLFKDIFSMDFGDKILTYAYGNIYLNDPNLTLLKLVCKRWHDRIADRDFSKNIMVRFIKSFGEDGERFLNGKLVYRPKEGIDEGMREWLISDLMNPLESPFWMSGYGDVIDKYMSISTGYRKRKKPENSSKVEIFIVPRFFIENRSEDTASHFKDLFHRGNKNASVVIFWSWGNWDDLNQYDYLVSNMQGITNRTLLELYGEASSQQQVSYMTGKPGTFLSSGSLLQYFMFVFG